MAKLRSSGFGNAQMFTRDDLEKMKNTDDFAKNVRFMRRSDTVLFTKLTCSCVGNLISFATFRFSSLVLSLNLAVSQRPRRLQMRRSLSCNVQTLVSRCREWYF